MLQMELEVMTDEFLVELQSSNETELELSKILGEVTWILNRNDLSKVYSLIREILGFYTNCDAHHATSPDYNGTHIIKAIEVALENAHVKPEAIDYINAHGTSTIVNDMIETLAIKKVFGAHAKTIPISSIKSMIGHQFGACGAIELIATALAIDNKFLPPTINYKHPDPACDLDYVPNKGRPKKIETAISNNFSFGGKIS